MESVIRNESITYVIGRIFVLAEKVTKQLKTEKKETGEFRGFVTIIEDKFTYCFSLVDDCGYAFPDNSGNLIPPTSKNFMLEVMVKQEGENFFACRIEKLTKNGYSTYAECVRSAKWGMKFATDCDTSGIVPLLNSGDVIAVKNESQKTPCWGKVAFARIEILSEEKIGDDKLLNVRLHKNLGHKEVYAYTLGADVFPTTYIADESTQEYFGDKDLIDKTIVVRYGHEDVCFNGAKWQRYTLEIIDDRHRLSTFCLGAPVTEQEVVRREKRKALSSLIEDCEAEFCYGDSRVEKYRKKYAILGNEVINVIHENYMAWLNDHCTTFTQDSTSGDFTGVAIDWHGNEADKPTFESMIE